VLGLTTYKIKRFKQKLAKVEENVTVAEEETDIFVLNFLKKFPFARQSILKKESVQKLSQFRLRKNDNLKKP